MALPSVSLYRDTLPPVIGVPRTRHASPMPWMALTSWPMTSGFSGLPKFRQLVAPRGTAPEQATFRAASATASFAPSAGSSQQNRPLQSADIARALDVLLTRTTAASPPGPCSVLVRTVL